MSEYIVSDRQIMLWIQHFLDTNGFPPTIREIAKGIGYGSTATVFSRIESLCARGYLATTPGKGRTLRILRRVQEKS